MMDFFLLHGFDSHVEDNFSHTGTVRDTLCQLQ